MVHHQQQQPNYYYELVVIRGSSTLFPVLVHGFLFNGALVLDSLD